jgi:DNA-binding HxlR family transcriptional regulator
MKMSVSAEMPPEFGVANEDEIFKALGNKNRRNIIKTLGDKGKVSFTDILHDIGDIDSPKLSYHLRSLKGMIEQSEGQYSLTEIGNAAVFLMNKIDQSQAVQKRKKKFMWANLTSSIFLFLFLITLSFILNGKINETSVIWILIGLLIVAQINQQVIWYLYRKSYSLPSLRTQFWSLFFSSRSGKGSKKE